MQEVNESPFEPPSEAPETSANVWVFYGREPKATPNWVTSLKPGSTLFWIHGKAPRSGANKNRIKAGDTAVIMVSERIVAAGVLLADNLSLFVDANNRVRRPIRLLDAGYNLPRASLQAATAGKLINQGSIHSLMAPALDVLNQLRQQHDLPPLPFVRGALRGALEQRSLQQDLVEAHGIRPDEATAGALAWRGDVWRLEDAAADTRRAQSSESSEGSDEPEVVEEIAEDDDGETPRPDALDSNVFFVLDAPADSEDELDRGTFALFLARRLHLIWCQLNGHAPGLNGQPTSPAPADADTFIAHVDSPWGGGKTTFANYVARTLDPRREVLSTRHFLRNSLAAAETNAGALAKYHLQDIFVPDFAKHAPSAWPGARRPWIVARFNAWRDQFVQPPWWQVFLTIQSAIARELRRDAGVEARAAWKAPWRLLSAAKYAAAYLSVVLQRFSYQIWNSKLKTQLLLWLLLAGFAALAWRMGVIPWVLSSSMQKGAIKPDDVTKWITLTVGALGLAGASLSTLFTVISQSFTPDLDFTAEHKQVGVQDPISRFRRSFNRIVRSTERPILLIVDDLDRCDPATVVELLRGFQTIIRSPRLFVLLLGDRAWIENAYQVRHAELVRFSEGEECLGARFVQKVIQLSFRLPAMKPEARGRFVRRVLGDPSDDLLSAKVAQVLRDVEQTAQEIVEKDQPASGREADLSNMTSQAKEQLPAGLSIDERQQVGDLVDNIASWRFVAASGSDTTYQRSVFNAVARLADSLPNNPRQIKRIFMAFAMYESVGRHYFGYQLTPQGPEGELKARRWRQLAIWVTLATEWPETWRALAREPDLLTAAYASRPSCSRAEATVMLRMNDSDRAWATVALQRLHNDAALRALLTVQSEPSRATSKDFASTEMEVDAIYEFNRLIWEPGFRLNAAATPRPSAPRTSRRAKPNPTRASAGAR